jgi:hypothetical protein
LATLNVAEALQPLGTRKTTDQLATELKVGVDLNGRVTAMRPQQQSQRHTPAAAVTKTNW